MLFSRICLWYRFIFLNYNNILLLYKILISLETFDIITYHNFVAAGKTNNKNKSKGPQAVVIFWLIFIIVIISVFMLNAETIQKNFNLFRNRITVSPAETDDLPLIISEDEPAVTIIIEPPAASSAPAGSETPRQQTTETVPVQTREPAASTSAPAPVPSTQPAQTGTQTQTPVRSIDRTIYFTQIRSDGQIYYSGVTRRLPVTESPMMDTLNIMLSGPSAEELGRGIINMIPQQTRILSATIRGSTAYINFNENFLFNTFGVEGYVAQLRQIVWTVTEFANISDVQFLVEGRRLDYLGEGIWIGSPISRQSF